MRLGRALVEGTATYGSYAPDGFRPIDGLPFEGSPAPPMHAPVTNFVPLSPVAPGLVLVVLGGFPRPGHILPETEPRLMIKGVAVEPGGDGSDVVWPVQPDVSRLFVEAELAVVIGSPTRHVGAADAWAHIAGFTVMNDVTAPDFGLEGIERARSLLAAGDGWARAGSAIAGAMFRAKSVDSFCSLGPWIETALCEQDIVNGLEVTTRVNGELRSSATTADLLHPVGRVVSVASDTMTLRPGDVIGLGTPEAVAVAVGDHVEITVERVGTLRNAVVVARPPRVRARSEQRFSDQQPPDLASGKGFVT